MGVVSQITDLDNSSAVALSQSAFASMLRFLGEPCMGVVSQIIDLDNSSKPLPYKSAVTSIVGEGCSPLGRRHEVTVGDSPVRGNVRKADKRVAVLAERKASPPRNAPAEIAIEN